MNTTDKLYQSIALDEASSIEQVEAALPSDQLDELSAIGDMRDDQRWKIGDRAREWIDDKNLPAVQICKIIARRTDYGYDRVRQFLYNSRYYYEHPDLREKYDLLRYSIFEHARGCEDPEAVLRAALEGRLSVTTVRETYLPVMDSLRAIMARVPKKYEAEARAIVLMALAKIKELVEK